MSDIHTTYEAVTRWMFDQVPMFQNVGAGAYKPGLDTVLRLSEAFGNPHRRLRVVHVAGTNGKGSTASTIAAVLTSAGYRTALYTSPHLIDFRERIRIDGEMISEEEVVDFINRYRAMSLPIEPSFFELTTVMAFDHFARHGVDYAVIEVGLGGRLDSTNIVTPLLSVITNISLDHCALLGNTVEAIAAEKAGIIKPGIPVVIGRAEGGVRQVFADKAAAVAAPIDFAQDVPAYTSFEHTADAIIYRGTPWGDITSELIGDCQPENANTVMHALQHLPFAVSADAVARGFARVTALTGLMGRWMTVSRRPRIICDTGHNPGGWAFLGPQLAAIAARVSLSMVLGFVNDKDVSTIAHYLPREARYYFATPSVKRGRNSADLAATFRALGIDGTPYPTVADALQAALADTESTHQHDATIFVGGSTFVVADLLAALPSRASE